MEQEYSIFQLILFAIPLFVLFLWTFQTFRNECITVPDHIMDAEFIQYDLVGIHTISE